MYAVPSCLYAIVGVFIVVDVFAQDSDRIVPQSTQTWPASSLTFVIDTTGSMQDDIAQVRAGANAIFVEILSQSDLPVQNFILVPFQDPDVGPVTVTRSTDVFQQALADLYVDGGGDCEERAISGIELALQTSLPGSFLFVFTDASAKDYDRTDAVINLIQSTRSQVVFVLTGDCGYRNFPEYVAYEKIATSSKGEIFHVGKKEDVGIVIRHIPLLVGVRQVNLFYAVNLPSTRSRIYTIPVDSCLQKLIVTVSTNGSFDDVRLVENEPVVVVVGPSGRRNYTLLVDENSVKTFHVEIPEPGLWRVHVASRLPYSLVVDGRSICNFKTTFFYSHTPGAFYQRPVIGERTNVVLNATEPDVNSSCRCNEATVTRMTLLRLNGEVMRTYHVDWSVDEPYKLVSGRSFVVPDHAFLVMVSGTDANGFDFQRISHTIVPGKAEPPEAVTPESTIFWAIRGEPLVLPCGYRSVVSVDIAWTKNGAPLSDIDERYVFYPDGRLVVLSTTDSDAGVYQCEIRSSEGNVSGYALNVSMAEFPVVTLFGDNLAIEPGQSVELLCIVDGRPNPEIEWVFNGTVLSRFSRKYGISFLNPLTTTLTVQKASVAYQGNYSCRAKNVVGSSTKTLSLKIQVGPRLTIVPDEAIVQEGGNIDLICRGEGLPLPRLYWYKGNRQIRSQLVSSSERRLRLVGVQYADRGTYTCIGINEKGRQEETMELTVHVAPSFLRRPADRSVVVGSNVTFNCVTDGNPAPTIFWRRGGNVVLNDGRISTNGLALRISDVRPADAGSYVCEATNIVGRVTATARMIVLVPPRIGPVPPLFVSTPLGGCVSFDCPTTGNPSPIVEWYRNGVAVSDSLSSTYPNGTLSMCGLDDGDSGLYECRATNLAGEDKIAIELDVQFGPVLGRRLIDQWILIGTTASFHCDVARAHPPAQITWNKDGRRVVVDDDVRISISNDGRRLVVADVETSDGGEYECRAENIVDSVRTSAVLHVVVPPTFSEDTSSTVTIRQSQTAFLHCLSLGFPKPTITWYRGSDRRIRNTPTKYQIFPNGTLQIRNAQEGDSGVYVCAANNRGGDARKNVVVDVQFAPIIVSAPVSQAVSVNNAFVLYCEGFGNPLPVVRWLQDGTEIGRGTQLRISSAQLESAGIYSCIIENSLGEDRANARIVVLVRPTIRQNVIATSVESGENVLLPCTASGIPPPFIAWSHNGYPIFNDRFKYVVFLNGTLKINNVQVDDAGLYQCRAINSIGDVTSNRTLDVKFKPVIMEYPLETSVFVGQCTQFNCSGYGNPSPVVLWERDGRRLSTGAGVRISSDGTRLTLCPVKAATAGSFTCVLRNSVGRFHASAQLHVIVPPSITTNVILISTIVGGSAFLPCDATGNPAPTISWYKNNARIENSPPKHRVFANGTLRIDAVSKADAGSYQCLAINEGGPTRRNISIDVYYGPSIIGHSRGQSVPITGNVRFHCTVSSNPTATIAWLKDGATLSLDSRHVVSHGGARLAIADVRSSDAGTYACVATNRVDSTRASMTLDVIVSPVIELTTAIDDDVTAVLDAVAWLPCNARGTPSPKIEWFRNGTKVIEVLPKIRVMQNGTLRIQNLDRADAGTYQCVATNVGGRDTKQIDLDVHFGPSITTAPRRQEVQADSDVTFRCIAVGNPTPRLTWDRDGAPLTSDSRVNISPDGTTLLVRDVQQNDTAYYACTATNTVINIQQSRVFKSTATARLDVIVPPYVVCDDYEIDAPVNGPAWLSCYVGGVPLPLVQWLKNGRLVFGSGYSVLSNGTLRITTVARDDSGVFEIVARNKVGMARESITLNVQYGPTIRTMIDNDKSVLVNQSVLLECHANGYPYPTVFWEYQGKRLLSSTPEMTVSSNGSRLLLKNIQVSSAGWYVCVAKNFLGQDSATVSIRVIEPPSPLGGIDLNLNQVDGRSVLLPCSVTGTPTPIISWFDATGNRVDGRDPRFRTTSNGLLRIRGLRASDSGTYVCNASNSGGSIDVRVTLNVHYSPSVNFISRHQTIFVGNSVNLSCLAEGNPSPKITWEFSGQPISTSGSQLRIDSVKTSNGGVYTCVATNVVSESRRSVQLSVIDPPRIATNVEIVSVNENGVALLPCLVSGSPRPTVYWITNDGSTVPPIDSRRRIVENNALRIANVRRSDIGSYRCVATNVGGSTNASVTFDVHYRPTILTISKDRSIVAGSSVTFLCDVAGNPNPVIYWEFMGRRLVSTPDGHLTIDDARLSDTGQYTCVAVNSVGEARLNTKIDVIEPPVLVESLLDVTGLCQSTVWLPCTVSGDPKPTISWFKNGSPIDLGNQRFQVMGNGTLRINSLSVANGGVYECVATNLGGLIAVNTTLIVQCSPRIVQAPTNRSAFWATTVSFTCIAEGNPSPTVSWRLPKSSAEETLTGSDLAHFVYSSDQTTLTIRNVQSSNSGFYECIATNRLGTVRSTAKLDVVVNTTCSLDFIVIEVVLGGATWLPCSASGIPSPTISWHRNGAPISARDLRLQQARNGSLRISNTIETDGGKYECQAVNSGGTAECEIFLLILVPPVVTLRPKNSIPIVGEDATFECNATGNPPPAITWKKDLQTIQNIPNNTEISNDGRLLTIFNVEPNDAGQYRCVVSNKVDETEIIVELKIRVSPTVTTSFIVTPILGSTAVLTCTVTGDPDPRVRWYFGGRRIDTLSLPRHRLTGNWSLEISDVEIVDDGLYTCEAVNTAGQANGATIVNVLYPATIIEAPQNVRLLAGQTATFTCKADGNPTPTIRWGKGSSASMLKDIPDGMTVSSDGTLLTITDVQPSKADWYTCLAENEVATDSRFARLRVIVPPLIRRTDVSVSAEVNGDVLLHCDVDGQPSPTVAWFKNGTSIVRETRYAVMANHSLIITDLRWEDRGTYECVAVNVGGEDRLLVTLDVLVPASVSVSPKNLEIIGTKRAIFTCIANGNPTPIITWRKDGDGATFSIERSQIQSSFGRSVLTIDRTKPTDSGRYVCVAKNGIGDDEDAVELKINVAPLMPDFTRETFVTYIRGSHIYLDCVTTGIPPPKIHWEFNGVRVDTSLSQYLLFPNGTLRIDSIDPSEGGNYTCVAQNKIGSIRGDIGVIVWELPSFEPSVVNHVIVRGDTVFMNCVARGNPTPSLSWEQMGHGVVLERDANRYTIFPNGTLKIVSVEKEDEGRYLCTATNRLESVSMEHMLDITIPPSIRPVDPSIVNVGQPAFLSCPSSGEPEPSFEWSFEGGTIVASSRYRLFRNGTLVIVRTKATDMGTYICRATNRAGTATRTVFLLVRVPPSIVDFSGYNLTVVVGDDFELPCGVTGDPVPQIEWSFDETSIDANTDRRYVVSDDGTLRVTRISRDDAGRYMCIARNPAGYDSYVVTVDVQYMPTIRSSSYGTNVTIGGTVELICRSVANPPSDVAWTFEGGSVSNRRGFTLLPSGSLRIEDIGVDNSGTYTCSASNKLGSDSIQVYVDVFYAPFVISERERVVVTEGKSVALDCLSLGNPNPKVTWKINGRDVQSGDGNFEIFPNGTLLIVSVRAEDVGTAKCVVTNPIGSVQQTHRITVNVKPRISSTGDVSFDEGETVYLSCPTVGKPKPTIEWYYNGYPVESVGNKRLRPLKNGRLRIRRVKPSDSGTYTCTATNEVGSDRLDISVLVKFSPRFTGTRMVTNVAEIRGGQIMLDCAAIGMPLPQIVWLKNGEQLSFTNRLRVFENGTLRIDDVQSTDAGRYTCRAENNLGTVESKVAVTVKIASRIVVFPVDTTVVLGESVTLECSGTGFPVPSITWLKNGVKVQLDSSDTRVSQSADGSLYVRQVIEEDEANYTCLAENSVGIDTAFARLIIIGKPVILFPSSSLKNFSIGQTVVFRCTVGGNFPVTYRWFKRGEELTSGNRYQIDDVVGVLTIRRLQSEDAGIYSCIATNDAGTDNIRIELVVTERPSVTTGNVNPIVVRVGTAYRIQCRVRGIPMPTVVWLKNGTVLVPNNSDRFTLMGNDLYISPIQLEDAGVYQCWASNVLGNAIVTVRLIVQIAPRIISAGPSIQYTTLGGRADFHCDVSSNPPATIRWFHNGYVPSGTTTVHPNGTLSLLSVRQSDAGNYQCSASNILGSALSQVLYLEVRTPPEIISPPQNVSTTVGSAISLPCIAMGTPLPTITWTLNGNTVSSVGRLTLSLIKEEHEGWIVCRAMNNAGSTSIRYYLEVIEPPVIENFPSKFIAVLGTKVHYINLTITGDRPLTCDWRKDGADLSRSSRHRIITDCSLVTYNVLQFDAGIYQLIVRNRAGWFTLTRRLLIYTCATARTVPQITLIAGSLAQLSCSSTGNPRPRITWSRDGNPITTQGRYMIRFDGTLYIFSPEKADAGIYTCTATNDVCPPKSSDVNLVVAVPPSISGSISSTQTLSENDTLIVPCQATGFPSPIVQWYRDGVPLSGSAGRTRIDENNTLIIERLSGSDAGLYRCNATNNVGFAYRTVLLTVKIIPPAPVVVPGDNTYVLDCAVEGISYPAVTWTKNGRLLPPDPRYVIAPTLQGSRLTINNAGPSDAGVYECSYAGGGSRVIPVESAPRVSLDKPLTRIGRQLLIVCRATGNPLPTVTWSRNGQQIVSNASHIIITEKTNSAVVSTLRAIELESGVVTYACTASNRYGSDTERVRVTITVVQPPPVQPLETSNAAVRVVTAQAGSSVTLKCQFTSNGEPSTDVRWRYESDSCNQSWVPWQILTSSRFVVDRRAGTLQIINVEGDDEGCYQCFVNWSNGQTSSRNFYLDVRSIGARDRLVRPPPAPKSTLSASGGQSTGLSCPYGPFVKWYKNGKPVQLDIRHGVQTDGSLKIRRLNHADSGRYECVEMGDVSKRHAVTLNVRGAFPEIPIKPNTSRFDCKSGFYVGEEGRLCIDVNECENGEAGCQYKCQNAPGSYKCICPGGYALAEDGKSCLDINECAESNGGCRRQCFNTHGGYQCIRSACSPAYKEIEDGVCLLKKNCSSSVQPCNIAVFLIRVAVTKAHSVGKPLVNLTAFDCNGRLCTTGPCNFTIANGNADSLFYLFVDKEACNGALVATRSLEPSLYKISVTVDARCSACVARTTYIILFSVSQHEF